MAVPRVFISSTCYDLGQVRDNLKSFIKSYYFEPVLSDNGDVFYHPDLHTHESCINEIGSCELFILIIGGRFGGNYIYDMNKSIVNAEYNAARKSNIPVFTFIKREVYEDHRVFQKNKQNKEVVSEIIFPSIEKQEYAINIFRFIDEVRHSRVNNGLFAFEFARDIEEYLGKQWSGMFCDFLKQRKYQEEYKLTKNLLSQLSIATEKTEEIVKSLYLHIDEKSAESAISNINEEVEAKKFFELVKKYFNVDCFYVIDDIDEVITNLKGNNSWVEFLLTLDEFTFVENCEINNKDKTLIQNVILNTDSNIAIGVDGELSKEEQKKVNQLEETFSNFRNLNKELKSKIISDNFLVIPF